MNKLLLTFITLLQDIFNDNLSSDLSHIILKGQNLNHWRESLKKEKHNRFDNTKFTSFDCFEDYGDKLIMEHECGKVEITE